ncbi:MAG: hypothetical protein JWP97_4591 [Labilithrix sp.]|nr:hypothetical protein [Labilithrix sp.]
MTAVGVLAAVGLAVACAVPNIEEDLPPEAPVDDGVPDSSFTSSSSSGGSSGSSGAGTDAAADGDAADAAVDAGPALDGTYTGTYTNNRTAFGCAFMNGGNLSATFTPSGAALTTTATVTGLEIRDGDCNLVGKVGGSAPSSPVTSAAGTFTGTWNMDVDQVGGKLDLPFTAKVAGKTVTGTWTCSGCTGGFSITRP